MTAFPFILQGDNIALMMPGKPLALINTDHFNYKKIRQALIDRDWDVIPDLVDVKRHVSQYFSGMVSFDGDTVKLNDTPVHNAISTRIVEFYRSGLPIEGLIRFYDRLQGNPSKRSVDELYTFLERCKLPITDDGCFLAYKKVRKDYKDCHSGTIDNSVGQVVQMPRNQVDDIAQNTCSHGLHFCSYDYLKSFSGEKVMVLKIDPADVVSIPVDYNFSKGRTWKYEVVDEIELERTKHNDVLTQQAYKAPRPTSFTAKDRFKAGAKLEEVWTLLTDEEIYRFQEMIAEMTDCDWSGQDDLEDYTGEFTYTEIRDTLRRMWWL